MTLRTLNYGNYGIFLIMGNAGFCPSTVSILITPIQVLITLLTKSHDPPSGVHGGEPLAGYSPYSGLDGDK